jgi:hypothetical protein
MSYKNLNGKYTKSIRGNKVKHVISAKAREEYLKLLIAASVAALIATTLTSK